MPLRMTAPRLILSALTVVSFLCPPAATASEAEIPWIDVLYYGEENPSIYWVSFSLISGHPRQKDHGLSKTEIENLSWSLKSRNKDRLDCKVAMAPFDVRKLPNTSLLRAFSVGRFSARGTIRHREPGWNPFLARVETLLYIELEEVFRDRSGRFRPGDIILWKEMVGTIEFENGYLCTIKPLGLFTTAVNDQVALVGSFRFPNAEPPLLEGGITRLLEIRNGVIQPPPSPEPPPEPLSLQELRTALASG